MTDLEIIVQPSTEALARFVASQIVAAIEVDGCRSLFLAGGTTPRRCYELVAERAEGATFAAVDIFYGDERMVPADHPDSNHGMASRALAPLALAPARVHRIAGELGAERAAIEAERALVAVLGPEPVPDLVLAGLGADGHTASLFPGESPGRGRWFHSAHGDARVSASLELLARAKSLVIVAAGQAKATAVAALVADREPRDPAGELVARATGAIRLVVDADAAAGIGR